MPVAHIEDIPHLFVKVARRKLSKTSRNNANKERAIRSMFQYFICNMDTMKISDRLYDWLTKKIAFERVRVMSDHRFVILYIDDEISNVWEIGEFKKMCDIPISPDMVLYRRLHGGYVLRGSALAQVLGDISNLGSFESRLRV